MAFRLVHEDRAYIKEPGDRLETHLGVLEVPDDLETGDVLETHLGHRFDVRPIRVPDCFDHFERSGAPMLPRDIGLIIGMTGVQAGDRILDIGTGTGVLAAALGLVGAEVISFERDDTAAEIARENLAMVDLTDRVTVRTGDGLSMLTSENLGPFDVMTLDTGDAAAITEIAHEYLTPGGFLAAYSPFVEQTRAIVETARHTLTDVRAYDTIQRELDVDVRGTRPTTAPVGHTGYLIIARRR